MASSSERRKGFWDEEEDEDQTSLEIKSNSSSSESGANVLEQKISDASVLLEQTHQLYQQFFNGVEKRAPIEKVQRLESLIHEMERLSVQGTTNRFKINQFLQHYQTMKDLWARKLRGRERT